MYMLDYLHVISVFCTWPTYNYQYSRNIYSGTFLNFFKFFDVSLMRYIMYIHSIVWPVVKGYDIYNVYTFYCVICSEGMTSYAIIHILTFIWCWWRHLSSPYINMHAIDDSLTTGNTIECSWVFEAATDMTWLCIDYGRNISRFSFSRKKCFSWSCVPIVL